MTPSNRVRTVVWIGMLCVPTAVALLDSREDRSPQEQGAGRPPAVAHQLPAFQPVGQAWDLERAYPHLAIRDALLLRESPVRDAGWYLVERSGRIVAFAKDHDCRALRVVLDLTERLGKRLDREQGVLGLAFHPAAADPESDHYRELFVVYCGAEPDGCFWRLSRFREGDSARQTLDSEVTLIDQTDPDPWHNAGCLEFGPDGFLYVATGDGGGLNDQFENGQRIDGGLFSGILRLDINCGAEGGSHAPLRTPEHATTRDYWIPDDNPFVGIAGALEEFWSIGFRNPFRMAFDAHTGDLWVGDTGAMDAEEINIARRGSNHQWSYREGHQPFPYGRFRGKTPSALVGVATEPRYVYRQQESPRCTQQGYCVIGGFVYRGERYPELRGTYLFGDYGTGRVFSLSVQPAENEQPVELLRLPSSGEIRLTSLAADRAGDVYLVVGPTAGVDAAIYRLVPVAPSTPALPSRLSETGLFENVAAVKPAAGLVPYEIRSPLWSSGTSKRRWIALPADGTIGLSEQGGWTFPPGTVFVKHFEVPAAGDGPPTRLETRVLVRDDRGGVYGATYRWNQDGRDATLVDAAGEECNVSFPVRNGPPQPSQYRLPARDECLHCHNAQAGLILGVTRPQLRRPLTPGGRETQLAAWSRRGFFERPLTHAEMSPAPTLVSAAERTAPLDARVRSYLDVNCAHCHRPNSNIRAWFDVRFSTPLAETGLIHGNVADALGISGGRLVVPGSPEDSLLYRRMAAHDLRHRMPPLAISIPDDAAIEDVYNWIRQLPPDAPRIRSSLRRLESER